MPIAKGKSRPAIQKDDAARAKRWRALYKSGVPQYAIAAHSGVNQSTVSRALSGRKRADRKP